MELLGTIVVPAGGAASNVTTAVPFSIPPKFKYVLIVTPNVSSGFTAYVGDDAARDANANEFNIGFSTSTQIAVPQGSYQGTVLSLFCSGAGGNCRVFGLWDLAQS